MPRLVWLSGLNAGGGLSTSLLTKGLLVCFLIRAHAWVVGQVPSRGRMRGNPLCLLPSPLSKNNKFLKITLNINGLNAPIKQHSVAKWIKKQENIPKESRTLAYQAERTWVRRPGAWSNVPVILFAPFVQS